MYFSTEAEWYNYLDECHFAWMKENGWTDEEIAQTRIEFSRIRAKRH